MRCWIRKYKLDDDKKIYTGYFAKHLSKNVNHWVQILQEAKSFENVFRARHYIKKYELKNCEIVRIGNTNERI